MAAAPDRPDDEDAGDRRGHGCGEYPITQVDVTENPVLAANNPQASGASITSTFSTFLTSAAGTASDISAYFPDNQIPLHWNDLVGGLHNFYLLTYARSSNLRKQYVAGLKTYFSTYHINSGIDWDALASGKRKSRNYNSSWNAVNHGLLGQRDQITAQIMNAPTPQF